MAPASISLFLFPGRPVILGCGRGGAGCDVRYRQLRDGGAGTNVLTQQLLHIQPGKTLAEQHAGSAPTLPYEKPKDRDAKRLARRALLRTIGKSFFGSVPFDTYLLMIVLTVANVKIPDWIASITQPLSGANALVSMLMVACSWTCPNPSMT